MTVYGRSVGFQTWSLYKNWAASPSAALAAIKACGLDDLEVSAIPLKMRVTEFKNCCCNSGMRILGYHAPALVSHEIIDLDIQIAMIRQRCSQLQTTNVTILVNDRGHLQTHESACDYAQLLNRAGKSLSNDGIAAFIHFYGYHLVPWGNRDGTALNTLLNTTDSSVGIQLDALWLAEAGYTSPDKFFDDFPFADGFEGRSLSLHLGCVNLSEFVTPDSTINYQAWMNFAKNHQSVRNVVIEVKPPSQLADLLGAVQRLGNMCGII